MNDVFNEYISHLYKESSKIIKRDTSVCYFDCTNYYCEIDEEDEDYIDEVTGEVFKGLRKFTFSKDHQPKPCVEMGLFMDAQGIPISMCVSSGSDNEQTLAVPLEKLVNIVNDKEFIYCADAGLGSYNIRKFNDMGGRKFIVTQSIKKLSEPLRQAVFNDYDYKLLSNDQPVTIAALKDFDRKDPNNLSLYEDKAYKVVQANTLLDVGLYEEKVCKNGNIKKIKSKATLKQNVIITFSRKMMEYQRNVRNRQVERAKELLKDIDPESYKKGPNDVTRFIKRKTTKGAKVSFSLDEEKIKEEEKYDGFYATATNLLNDHPRDILAINKGRYKIEDCFRVMKTNLGARPIHHQSPEHIRAHFMVCYTALLIYRIMEVQLDKYGSKLKEGVQHFTTKEIITTLQNMSVANCNDMYYMATYKGSQVLNALNAIYHLDLDRKYYEPKELNKKVRKSIIKKVHTTK